MPVPLKLLFLSFLFFFFVPPLAPPARRSDNANRLNKANFFQSVDGGSTWTSSALNFSTYGGDVSNPNNLYAIGYDANGNILSMYNQGFMVGGSTLIDVLQYSYYTNSNKLMQVYDGANEADAVLGDFHYKNGTKTPGHRSTIVTMAMAI